MINKRRITLPVVYSRPLAQKRFFERFWMNLSSPLTVLCNRKTREENLFWKGFSAGANFSPKFASLRFQTSQHESQKIHVSSRIFQSKIYPNGPELTLEENQNPTVFERLECVARFSGASDKLSRWLIDRCPIRKGQSARQIVRALCGLTVAWFA